MACSAGVRCLGTYDLWITGILLNLPTIQNILKVRWNAKA